VQYSAGLRRECKRHPAKSGSCRYRILRSLHLRGPVASAGLAIHSFWNLTKVDLGIKTDHILTFFLPVPDEKWKDKDPVLITNYYRDILARIDAVPGVQYATAMTGLPPYGAGFGMPFTLAGGPTYADPSQRPSAGFGMVTPGYFSTFGIQLRIPGQGGHDSGINPVSIPK
jgi:putative ABC transport system permease protein